MNFFVDLLNKYHLKKVSVFLPFLYILLLLVGLIVYALQMIIPSFDNSICITIFQNKICTLVGIFIAVIPSLPGYFILGSRLFIGITNLLPISINYMLVAGTNILMYAFIGSVLYSTYRVRKDYQIFIPRLILFVFLVLFIAIIFLYF